MTQNNKIGNAGTLFSFIIKQKACLLFFIYLFKFEFKLNLFREQKKKIFQFEDLIQLNSVKFKEPKKKILKIQVFVYMFSCKLRKLCFKPNTQSNGLNKTGL